MGKFFQSNVARVFATGLGFAMLGSGCVENSALLSKTGAALSQNCPLPNSAAVKNIGLRLASQSVEVDREFCGNVENYRCHVRVFSPTVSDGRSKERECGRLSEVGGAYCLAIAKQSYNTRDASVAPDSDPAASLPGGDYNRSEYVCHHQVLKDGDLHLAVGNGETLSETLARSVAECASLAPRIASVKEAGTP